MARGALFGKAIVDREIGMIKRASFVFAAAALLAGAASPAMAQAPAAPSMSPASVPIVAPQPAAMLPFSAVTAYYASHRQAAIWFRGGANRVAAERLAAILRRAPLDGLASGPQLALQVEAAFAKAASGTPADVQAAEQTMSAAWVLYVQAIKRPTPGMIYAYASLSPQGSRADQVLLTASAAPSLEVHLDAVARVNPIYAQIRDAGIAAASAAPGFGPDPRIVANLERARSIPARGRFILVDVATQRLFMYENGQPIDSMKVVVGMNEYRTPMIASIIHYAVFKPYWDVPHHLVKKMAPSVIKQGAAYLKGRGYDVMSDWTHAATVIPASQVDWKAVAAGTKQIRVRQLPGAANSMGKIKYPFPNGEGIYLHDTPTREHFLKSRRDISNGCIRLEDAARLGRWMLGREPVGTTGAAEEVASLPTGMPIFVTYLTAQPSGGQLTFVTDFYGLDGAGPAKVAAVQ